MIPFEQYRGLTIGINLVEAKRLGITIPDDLLAEATVIFRGTEK